MITILLTAYVLCGLIWGWIGLELFYRNVLDLKDSANLNKITTLLINVLAWPIGLLFLSHVFVGSVNSKDEEGITTHNIIILLQKVIFAKPSSEQN